ncbi:DUF1491 family protein [bacterium M00.F.Ca.ET.194.01.1.1]|nr:DUF1491 family protein [bacterium M00.F.Ca.ET.194.01.1.1]
MARRLPPLNALPAFDRFFIQFDTSEDGSAFDARLEREKKFDPDIWVVEIEAGTVPVEELLSVKTD